MESTRILLMTKILHVWLLRAMVTHLRRHMFRSKVESSVKKHRQHLNVVDALHALALHVSGCMRSACKRLLLLLLRNLFESEFSRQVKKQSEREEYEKEVEQEIARQREENARKRLQAQKNLQEAQDHSQKSIVDYVREAHELNPDTGPIPQPLPPNSDRSPEVKRGPRGGRYTEDRTKDGRPYRRYF